MIRYHGSGSFAVDVLAVAGAGEAQEIAAHRHFGDTYDAAPGPDGRDRHRTHGSAVETTLEPFATRHFDSGRGCRLGVELANFIRRAGPGERIAIERERDFVPRGRLSHRCTSLVHDRDRSPAVEQQCRYSRFGATTRRDASDRTRALGW